MRQVVISSATLGTRPWTVEARGGTADRALVTLVVDAADDPNRGYGQYIDLSCGRIWVWVGPTPDAPVGPIADAAGDCVE